MSIQRKLSLIQSPPQQKGFLGPDHMARPVIQRPFSESDPFILLMDDILDKRNNDPVGGPHPHAGFETVSLLLEGEIGDDAHKMKGGDFQMMTAGSGVVHTETIDKAARLRLLQLWLNLPRKDRWAPPRVQDLAAENVPKRKEGGVEIKVYSGSLSGLTSPVRNYAPIIVADIKIEPGVTTTQELPANYNTFLYVVHGGVTVGKDYRLLQKDQVGWLDLFATDGPSELTLSAGDEGVHLILYAGKPLGEHMVSHGPFIGDSHDDIKRLYLEFHQGKMEHISSGSHAEHLRW